MTELTLAGAIDNALTHMALTGLAAILDDRSGPGSRIWWTQDWPARPKLSCDRNDQVIAQAVIDHAANHHQPQSWVSQRLDDGPRSGGGVFTVRATAMPNPAQWQSLATRRRDALGLLGSPSCAPTQLDQRMLVALGEPAFWWHDHNLRRPDDGASRWEMKTRNRGEEFIRDRLATLAEAVSARTSETVISGLTGAALNDEAGKNSSDSRTPTGLTTPGPTDNALAWCALWGISAAPTIHRLADPTAVGMSQSPGTWPRNRVHPSHYALPVFTEPTTASRWAAILSSQLFDQQMQALISAKPHDESRLWLAEQGVRAIVTFPTRVVGSKAAPERQLLTGTVHPM